jgi:hypothetical protein
VGTDKSSGISLSAISRCQSYGLNPAACSKNALKFSEAVIVLFFANPDLRIAQIDTSRAAHSEAMLA